MPTALPSVTSSQPELPTVLVVDDEADMIDLFRDTVAPKIECRMKYVRSLADARRFLRHNRVELVVTDINLTDGSGLDLLETIALTCPSAATILMTGAPTLDQTVHALRHGAADYCSKPFSAEQMQTYLRRVLHQQAVNTRNVRRLSRLKSVVRKLSRSRRTMNKKVDLLCNDLVTAYGEVAAEVTEARQTTAFRTAIESAVDLEQLLCHAMDWLLKEAGHSNIAIWLNGEHDAFELGAYMKYTVVGDKKTTNALHAALIKATLRDGLVHRQSDEFAQMLTPAQQKLLPGQTVMSAACSYLGEPLAVIAMFRDGAAAFKPQDITMLRNVAAVFAALLASMVRGDGPNDIDDAQDAGLVDEEPHGDGPDLSPDDQPNDPNQRRRSKSDRASDWWKHGEAPPF